MKKFPTFPVKQKKSILKTQEKFHMEDGSLKYSIKGFNPRRKEYDVYVGNRRLLCILAKQTAVS